MAPAAVNPAKLLCKKIQGGYMYANDKPGLKFSFRSFRDRLFNSQIPQVGTLVPTRELTSDVISPCFP